jgi:hypothetical protein
VENARLAETSGVYKGSTPGAVIVKAERDAEAGTMKPEARQLIEQRYRIHLPEKRVQVPGHKERTEVAEREAEPVTPPPAEQGDAPPIAAPPAAELPPAVNPPSDEEEREVAQLLTRAGVTNEKAKTAILAARALAAEVERLKPLADDGTKYRERLRERVIQEQVRATGGANESFKSLVSRATVTELEGMLPDLAKRGNELFGGGRQTVDEAEEPPVTRVPEVPDAAFA